MYNLLHIAEPVGFNHVFRMVIKMNKFLPETVDKIKVSYTHLQKLQPTEKLQSNKKKIKREVKLTWLEVALNNSQT